MLPDRLRSLTVQARLTFWIVFLVFFIFALVAANLYLFWRQHIPDQEQSSAIMVAVLSLLVVGLALIAGWLVAYRFSKPLEHFFENHRQAAACTLPQPLEPARVQPEVVSQNRQKDSAPIPQLQQQPQAARTANPISQANEKQHSIEETLLLISTTAREVLGMGNCAIIVNQDRKPPAVIAAPDCPLFKHITVSKAESLFEQLHRFPKPLILDGAQKNPPRRHDLATIADGSLMVFGLREQKQLLGALVIQNPHPRVFTREDIEKASHLADLTTSALVNYRLIQRLTSQTTVDSLTELPNQAFFLRRLEEEINRCHVDNEGLSLALIDLDYFNTFNNLYGFSAGNLALKETARIIEKYLRPCDTAARYGIKEFALILPRVTGLEATIIAQKIRREIEAFPYLNDGVHQASLTVSIGISFFPGDAATKQELMEHATAALEYCKMKGRNQVRLYQPGSDRLPSRAPRKSARTKLLLSGVYALAAAVDAHDHYTHQHSQSVARYSSAMAASLGLSEEETENISIAGLLHDVGKIGVSDTILKKSDLLAPEELEEMKAHPTIAGNILKHITGLEPIIPMIVHHHERYDGTGYPDGLAGTQIPLGSRIIAVADAYHAMITDRPYRKALNQEQALAELLANSNTQLDPVIVQHLISVLHKASL